MTLDSIKFHMNRADHHRCHLASVLRHLTSKKPNKIKAKKCNPIPTLTYKYNIAFFKSFPEIVYNFLRLFSLLQFNEVKFALKFRAKSSWILSRSINEIVSNRSNDCKQLKPVTFDRHWLFLIFMLRINYD